MAMFGKDKLSLIVDKDTVDLTTASLSSDLSTVDFNSDEKYFFITIDKVLFANPIETIRSVLDAHGFVSNLENILSCLDSLQLCIHAKVPDKEPPAGIVIVSEYLPCIRFEMPQKGKIGRVLQSFYDEFSKYENKIDSKTKVPLGGESDALKVKSLDKENKELGKMNVELKDRVSLLTQQLIREQTSLSRASRALDSQRMLPENTSICRVEDVNLKKRFIKVKVSRKLIEIPMQILDRVPERKARCIVTFDENNAIPVGVLFFDKQELRSIEKRIAKIVYVEGDSFKALDLERNEYQIKALNERERMSIKSLQRGMDIIISIANNYVVRFFSLGTNDSKFFADSVEEQLVVYGIGRNQLVGVGLTGKSQVSENNEQITDDSNGEEFVDDADKFLKQNTNQLN
jgi:hypothetical protein